MIIVTVMFYIGWRVSFVFVCSRKPGRPKECEDNNKMKEGRWHKILNLEAKQLEMSLGPVPRWLEVPRETTTEEEAAHTPCLN